MSVKPATTITTVGARTHDVRFVGRLAMLLAMPNTRRDRDTVQYLAFSHTSVTLSASHDSA